MAIKQLNELEYSVQSTDKPIYIVIDIKMLRYCIFSTNGVHFPGLHGQVPFISRCYSKQVYMYMSAAIIKWLEVLVSTSKYT